MAVQFPSSPSVNQQYSFSNKTWIWSGNTWDLVSLSVLAVSPTEPVTPSIGALWLNTSTNNLTIYNGSLFIAPNVANLVLKANITDLTTANVVELTSLYFTNARVYSAVTGNLALKSNVADLTTANVVELINLYFTDTRARDTISVDGFGEYDNTTGIVSIYQQNVSVNGRIGPVSGLAETNNSLSQFASTTSLELITLIFLMKPDQVT